MIDGKHGWTRANVLGGQFNYTGRNVIVLDPTLKLDEIDVSYKSFIVLFSGKIIREIMNDKGWTITKAHNYLKAKFQYDDYVYSIIELVIEKYKPWKIINRNPTITFGSILKMRIRSVKRDSDDMTLKRLGSLNLTYAGSFLEL